MEREKITKSGRLLEADFFPVWSDGRRTLTIHCVVGQASVETLGDIFSKSARQASSNYGIGYDGKIGMYVEEKDRSWCTSSPSNDHRAVTIEVASDSTEPYAVNDKAYASLLTIAFDGL